MTTYAETAEWLAETAFVTEEDEHGEWTYISPEVFSVLVSEGGAYRKVILDTEVVYKLTRNGTRDVIANRDEWNRYHAVPEEVRHLLAKPLYISDDGSVIVMERFRSTLKEHNPDNVKSKDFEEMTARKFQAAGVDEDLAYRILWDCHYGNIGHKMDGTLALLDYGG